MPASCANDRRHYDHACRVFDPIAGFYQSEAWRSCRAAFLKAHPHCARYANAGRRVAATIADQVKPTKMVALDCCGSIFAAVERGVLPASIAMGIARAKDSEVQRALADAYEKKALPGNQILAIRKIIEQRKSGKGVHSVSGAGRRPAKRVTAEMLVRTYRKETERQKLLVKKATLTQSRLLFVVNALRRLLADEHFVTLLRAEAIQTIPRPLAERMATVGG